MSPFPHLEPTPSVTTGLTAEAAHVRRVLAVAADGPPSTRGLVVGLMGSLIQEGYRTSVSWYLAPSPADDLHEVMFSLRSGDQTVARQVAIEQMRASLNRLTERMDRRLSGLEGEVRRRATPPAETGWSGPDQPVVAPSPPWTDPSAGPSALRVVQPDDGR